MKTPKLDFKELYSIYTKKYPEIFKFHERKVFIAYLYLTLTLFTISVFGVFAILPTITTISKLRKQYADNQLVYNKLKTKLSALQTLDTKYQLLQPEIQLVNKAVPQTTEIPTLIRQIETLATQNNLSILSINAGTVEYYPTTGKTPPIYSFPITMSLRGAPTSTNQFISQIINFERIMGIDSISSGSNAEDKSEISITGRVYFYAKK